MTGPYHEAAYVRDHDPYEPNGSAHSNNPPYK